MSNDVEKLKDEYAELVYRCRLFLAEAERHGKDERDTYYAAKDLDRAADKFIDTYQAIYGYY